MTATGQATKRNHLVTEQLELNAVRFRYFKLTVTIAIISLLFAAVFGLISGIVFEDYQYLSGLQLYIEVAIQLTFHLAMVFLILWFGRAYSNLFVLGKENLRHDVNWGFFSWYVPGLNFFMPFRILKDVYVGFSELAGDDDQKGRSVILKLRVFWWVLYSALPVLYMLSIILLLDHPTAMQFLLLALYKIFMVLFWIIGLYITEQIHEREERVYRMHTARA